MSTDLDVNSLEEVKVECYINYGPDFLTLSKNGVFDNFYRADNYFGIPISMEIYSSINSFYRYGVIVFEDNQGYREKLPLTGNEILTVRYKNKSKLREGSFKEMKTIHFNIYDIEEDQLRPDSTQEEKFQRKIIRLHIVEAPFYLEYNNKDLQTMYGVDNGNGTIDAPRIDEIIREVIEKELNIVSVEEQNIEFLENSNGNDSGSQKIGVKNFFEINFDEMSDSMPFKVSCPSWKPQKFFKYLLEYARDKQDNGNVKLFTTSDPVLETVQINLKSMNNMFVLRANKYYNLDNNSVTPKIVDDLSLEGLHFYTLSNDSAYSQEFKKQSAPVPLRNLNQIFKYKFLSYDLSTLSTGLPGASLMNFDYEGSIGYHYVCDTYELSNIKDKYFENFSLWKSEISNNRSAILNIGRLPSPVAKAYVNNRIIENKFQLRCEALAFVNEIVEVGDVIAIEFMTLGNLTEGESKNILDEQMSGCWLVEDIIDFVFNDKGYRKYTLVKDSHFNVNSSELRTDKLDVNTQVTKIQEGFGSIRNNSSGHINTPVGVKKGGSQ